MVNVLNKKITEELGRLFEDANECVLVDFHGLSVEEVNALRTSLTENNIRMQVIRNALAANVLKAMDRSEYEDMLVGPTAVVWGGEGILQVSKAVHDFTKKSKKLRIKGGFLGPRTIDSDEVTRLTTVPDRPVLLGSLVYAFMNPLQGLANGLNSLLSSIVNLVDALHEKLGGEGDAPESDGGDAPGEEKAAEAEV